MNEPPRPDGDDVTTAGCGWLLMMAVIAHPGFVLNDGPLTLYLVVVGSVTGCVWARKRLRR
ncbi:hypothetical protein [Streptomyces soliscabiei]|uniref:hypothetical protein n=1 Tax=Streptomyces soliscabiei TaxID=588897 RepID=UPI0029B55BE9|nr:hypothetical protein [Streptomyces sp. NY05-11A]MDX2682199.1 hypothetical protein [Streptomyces sp. NY05-11A]